MPLLLSIQSVSKSFPGVQALTEASLEIRQGEVHALVGENGAGKSTLCRIICGLYQPEAGRMLLQDQTYAPTTRHNAESLGVAMVMQELNLVPTLTVAENIFLRRMPRRFGIIDYRSMNQEATDILGVLGLTDIDPIHKVETLGVGQQQMVEIASVLSRRCRLLILDEPTAALTHRETDRLFEQVARLKQAGVAILYVSHRMEEIKRIADSISVLRDGRHIATRDAESITFDELVRLMVGRELRETAPRQNRPGAVALRVEGLCRGTAVRDVSFELRRGEILGFAGLMGSGRTETMRLIFGADRRDAGCIYLYGSATPAIIRQPRDAVRQGIALLTEDRKHQGLLLPLSIYANTTLTNLPGVSMWRTLLRPEAERCSARALADGLSLRRRNVNQAVLELSGGNQQKVVIAKWLYRDCDILIFDEPTRGIDIGAKFEVYRLLSNLAHRGKAVLIVSSDLPELLMICDRIAVMSAGRLHKVFARDEFTQDVIMSAALAGHMNVQEGIAT